VQESPSGFRNIVSAARKSFLRFPGVVLSSALATLLVLHDYFTQGYWTTEPPSWRTIIVAILGIPWLYSLHLFFERRLKGLAITLLPLLLGSGSLALYFWRLGKIDLGTSPISFAFELMGLSVGLHCLAAYAPFLGFKEGRGFWEYNRRIFLRFLAALLFSATLLIGISILMALLLQVLGLSHLDTVYIILSTFIVGIFNTWFFVSGVPEDFEKLETEPGPYPRGLKVFAQYILMPLILVIGLVLEIWLLQDLARGKSVDPESAGAFFTWGGFALLTYLLLYPLREEPSQRGVRVYEKVVFLGLIPLLSAITYAVFRLIGHFGWTPPRYYSLILSLWGLGLCAYLLLSKERRIKWIPMSLSLIAFLTLAGPWSAYSVGLRNRQNHLRKTLLAAGITPGSPALEPLMKLPAATKDDLLAQISYLEQTYGCESLQPSFGARLEGKVSGGGACETRNLHRLLWPSEAPPSPETYSEVDAAWINFFPKGSSYKEVPVKGFDYYFSIDSIYFLEGESAKGFHCENSSDLQVCAVLPKGSDQLSLSYKGRPLGKIDLGVFSKDLVKKFYKPEKPLEPGGNDSVYLESPDLALEKNLPGGTVRLDIHQLRLEKRGELITPDYLTFSLLFKEGT